VIVVTCEKWLEFERSANELMQREHIAGAAVAVMRDGEIIYKNGFGYKNVTKKEPVTPETIFGIGSVSKSFTAIAIMQLIDQGKLSVTDPAVKYIPEFNLPGVDMSTIKIHHLLSHSTGLPPMKRRQDVKTFDGQIQYLASKPWKMLGKPGEYFSYANDTFLLLGAIIERITGTPYRRYMTENLVSAIGMPRTTYTIEDLPVLGNYTEPYIWDKASKDWKVQPWPQLGIYEVGGGVRSNVVSMMRYAEVHLSNGMIDGKRIVSENGLRLMRTPVIKVDRNAYYCYALRVTQGYNGVTLVEHGGGQPGVSANFGYAPEKNVAVMVLTNVTGMPAGELWLMAMNTALGLPIDERRSIEPSYTGTADQMKAFEGEYAAEEGGNFKINFREGQLWLTQQDEVLPLRMSDERSLVYSAQGFESPIRFWFAADGKPWAALAHSRMLHRIA
jgi:CubicO group peptidase (beta-lactamase class C family)